MVKWRSLTRQSEFQKVYREGVKQVGHLLVVYLLPAEGYRRGIVASRKVGGAVQRNRAKRLLRAAMAAGLPGREDWVETALDASTKVAKRSKAPTPGPDERSVPDDGSRQETGGVSLDRNDDAGLWIVMVARRNILEANSAQVRQELDGMLQRFAPGYEAGAADDPD